MSENAINHTSSGMQNIGTSAVSGQTVKSNLW